MEQNFAIGKEKNVSFSFDIKTSTFWKKEKTKQNKNKQTNIQKVGAGFF